MASQKMLQKQFDVHVGLGEGYTLPYPTPHTKNNAKQREDVDVKGKAIKMLEENMGEYLHDFEVGKYFLNETEKAIFITEILYIVSIKIENFCLSKRKLHE